MQNGTPNPAWIVFILLGAWATGCSNTDADPVRGGPSDAPGIPSVAESPPRLGTNEIGGTAWEVDLSKAPGDKKSTRIYRYDFHAGGQAVLNTRPVEESDPDSSRLFQALSKDMQGTWAVNGPQIEVTLQMMGKAVQDQIEIRGEDLFYHGVKMSRL